MKKAEKIFIIVAITGLLLKLMLIPGGGALLVISLLSLSGLYFYLGFAFFNDIPLAGVFKKTSYVDISKWRRIGSVATGIVFGMVVTGITFWLQFWPGSSGFLFIGIILLLPIIAISLIRNSKVKSDFYKRIFTRAIILGWLAISLFYLVHKNSYANLIYRNHPAYRDALIQLNTDPSNEELQKKEQEERYKMQENRRRH